MTHNVAKADLLTTIPVRIKSVSTVTGADGLVSLMLPRIRVGWLNRLFPALSRRCTCTIALEEYGSAVWLNIDGHASVADVIASVRQLYPDVPDLERRVSLYVARMHRDGLITLLHPSANTAGNL